VWRCIRDLNLLAWQEDLALGKKKESRGERPPRWISSCWYNMGAVCTRGGGGGRGGIDWDALIEAEEAKEAKEREKAEKKSKPSPENEEDGDAREDGDGTTKMR
jgi:hypothetical protein